MAYTAFASRDQAVGTDRKGSAGAIGSGIEVLVYMADQKDLFARICEFFDHIDYNIVQAKIHTTRHGYALDTFLVLDSLDMAERHREMSGYIGMESPAAGST